MEIPAVQTRKMHLTELTFIILKAKHFWYPTMIFGDDG